MMGQIWEMIISNPDEWDLVDTIEIEGSENGFLYKHTSKAGEYMKIGTNAKGREVNHIEFFKKADE